MPVEPPHPIRDQQQQQQQWSEAEWTEHLDALGKGKAKGKGKGKVGPDVLHMLWQGTEFLELPVDPWIG